LVNTTLLSKKTIRYPAIIERYTTPNDDK
jgi:hypothetical protein